MREIPKEIAQRLREEGYTMKEIAVKLDCTERTVWNYVHNISKKTVTVKAPLPVANISKMMEEAMYKLRHPTQQFSIDKVKELERHVG